MRLAEEKKNDGVSLSAIDSDSAGLKLEEENEFIGNAFSKDETEAYGAMDGTPFHAYAYTCPFIIHPSVFFLFSF